VDSGRLTIPLAAPCHMLLGPGIILDLILYPLATPLQCFIIPVTPSPDDVYMEVLFDNKMTLDIKDDVTISGDQIDVTYKTQNDNISGDRSDVTTSGGESEVISLLTSYSGQNHVSGDPNDISTLLTSYPDQDDLISGSQNDITSLMMSYSGQNDVISGEPSDITALLASYSEQEAFLPDEYSLCHPLNSLIHSGWFCCHHHHHYHNPHHYGLTLNTVFYQTGNYQKKLQKLKN
jgi:hypothetical protein